MYCSKCGAEISENARFCPSCGERVEEKKVGVSLKKESDKNDLNANNIDNHTHGEVGNNGNGYHKEYSFKSQAKSNGIDIGPITLVEGYSTKTDIIVDNEYLKSSQTRVFGKPKENQFRIGDIKKIEEGNYFPLWLLLLLIVMAAVCAFTPIMVGTSPLARLAPVAVIAIIVLFEAKNRRVTISTPADKLVFDSRDKGNVKAFVEDMRTHPSFTGRTGKSLFVVQKISLIALVALSAVMIISPNPFASSNLYKGTYQEWADAYYPDNYRTWIIADVTFGIDDTENDSILVYAGDNFDQEIFITNNKGQSIKDWDWLHNATPIEDNIAIFEITLTRFKNDDMIGSDLYFVYSDPVAVSYEEYASKFGINTVENIDYSSNNIETQDDTSDAVSAQNNEVEEKSTVAPMDSQTNSDITGNYLDYWDWCGSYDGGWMDTSLWFGLYSDGTQNPECGYLELNFRGNEFRGPLYYLGDNQFYSEVAYASSTDAYYVIANTNSGKKILDIYNADQNYECTYTMEMSYDEYVENEYQNSMSDEYIVYGSDSGYFDRSYFENFTDDELRLARNEILARHGRTFKDQQLQNYFNSKSWYTPQYSPDEFDPKMEQMLNQWEKANIETIKQVEASRK